MDLRCSIIGQLVRLYLIRKWLCQSDMQGIWNNQRWSQRYAVCKNEIKTAESKCKRIYYNYVCYLHINKLTTMTLWWCCGKFSWDKSSFAHVHSKYVEYLWNGPETICNYIVALINNKNINVIYGRCLLLQI